MTVRTHKSWESFAKQMYKFADDVPDVANKVEIEMATMTLAELARATPIDVGTARSNWVASIGSAYDGTRAAFSPYPSRHRPPYGPGGSMGEGRNQAGAVWSAAAALKGKKPGEDIHITNNLPYIMRLNQGHSSLAAAGFIERAIQTGRQRGMELARKLMREKFG